jgi:putative peptidoglycan binding protein
MRCFTDVDVFASAETMIVKITDFSTTRYGKLVSATSAILILLLLPEFAAARKPQLPDTGITRGKTAAGFYYINGGLTFDEQQAMERRSASYNLKLLFAPPAGTLVSPVLLLIGDNQGRFLRVQSKKGSEDTKKLQEALKAKGHDPGLIDGIMGPKTRTALKAFQEANGIKGTGRLDDPTAEKLGLAKPEPPTKKEVNKMKEEKK